MTGAERGGGGCGATRRGVSSRNFEITTKRVSALGERVAEANEAGRKFEAEIAEQKAQIEAQKEKEEADATRSSAVRNYSEAKGWRVRLLRVPRKIIGVVLSTSFL